MSAPAAAPTARALIAEGDRLEREMDFPRAWAALADGGSLRRRGGYPALREVPEWTGGAYSPRGLALRRLARRLGARFGLVGAGTDPALHGVPEWTGGALPPRGLVVRRLIRHVGAQLRMGRVAAEAARAGPPITLCAEPRLEALFARSFPGLTIAPEAEADALIRSVGHWTSYERLAQHLWTSPAAIARSFRPLLADPARQAALAERYRAYGTGPVIGLSWYSTNTRKDLPAPADWAAFLGDAPCRPVSLQYAPDPVQLAILEAASGGTLIVDPEIDPIADLDAAAAQIAATDLVVTISNTTAHMAGAMGHPCIVLLDDGDHLSWPRSGAGSCYYPSVLLLRKAGRTWPEVLRAAAGHVHRG